MDNSLQPLDQVKKSKKWIIILVSVMLLATGGIATALILLLPQQSAPTETTSQSAPHTPIISQNEEKVNTYFSPLTGLPVKTVEATQEATYCVQVPNGTDGARPQAGLDQAGIIFEAIAERGITRFAAIFQGSSTPVIGPMRSLRLYYLQWDTPFDCTIIHDGGADDALAAVRSYKDFTGFGNFVWRSSTNSILNRRWNNEFTSGELLAKYNETRGYGSTSEAQGFTRHTPDTAKKQQADALATNPLDIDTETDASTSTVKVETSKIHLKFGNLPNYNPVYTYDINSNTYKRGYESSSNHEIYDCKGQTGEVTPEKSCDKTILAPKVVVAMIVQESLASDGYHENITTLGSGKAYIFQNGLHFEATWKKPTVADQIKFYDATGAEIPLAPGQTIISAIPNYGKVEYE